MGTNVLVLQVYTTVDLEHVQSELTAILREIKRWCKWIRVHRLQSFIILTDETPLDLWGRLQGVLIERPGIAGFYCFTAPEDVVGNYGELEALRFHIDGARLEARQRDRSPDMRDPHRRHFRKRRV